MTDSGEATAAAAALADPVPALHHGDQPPAAAAAAGLIPAQQPLCPMLTALGRDRDSCASLCEFLRLPEMAVLHASCRRWRRWIDPPPGQTEAAPGQAVGSKSRSQRAILARSLMLPYSRVAQLLACRWLCRCLDQLEVSRAPPTNHGPVRFEGPLKSALPLLPWLPLALQRLEVHNDTAILRFVLSSQDGAATVRVQTLHVHINGNSEPPWFEQLDQPLVQAELSQLQSFRLTIGSLVPPDHEPSLAPLARLPALDTFIYSKSVNGHIDFSALVSSLISCRRLTRLDIGCGMQISTADLTALLSGMPQLVTLILHGAQLQSVGPLEAAPKLESLTLDRCSMLGSRANPEWRDALPPLAHLTALSIIDADDHRLSARDAEPLNHRLMEKMSKLRAENFTQNLLSEAIVR